MPAYASPCQHRPPLRSRRCCGFAVYIFVVIVLPASKLAQNNDYEDVHGSLDAQNNDNEDVHGSLDAQNASAGEPHRGVITRCTTLLYFIGRCRLKPHYRYGSHFMILYLSDVSVGTRLQLLSQDFAEAARRSVHHDSVTVSHQPTALCKTFSRLLLRVRRVWYEINVKISPTQSVVKTQFCFFTARS